MAEQKTAIVTGASRGIGRGIALALAAEGWFITVNYNSNREAAEETLAEIKRLGGAGLAIQANVRNLEDHPALVEGTLQATGRIDLLVNNAGVGPKQRLDMLQMTPESYDRVLETNLRGPFFLTQRVANVMINQPPPVQVAGRQIINISSISAYTSSPARAEYCISKAGLSMTTTLWADRLAEYDINVYEIRPGIIATDLTAVVKDKYDRMILDEGVTPIRRWGEPADIGKAVVAIASGWLPFSTGEVINVDGGFHISRL
jgi:NAD(P)-dependent dehydrogenase (short-subunit alcohol dehydrogenase family)